MSEFEFGQPELIHLIWAVPVMVLLVVYGQYRRRRMLGVFGIDPVRMGAWLVVLRRRRMAQMVMMGLAMIAMTVAALQPRANPKRQPVKTSIRDLAIVLDVSKSMLANDLSPSRLERAKLELSRLADTLSGDRVGLVAFAGDSVVVCPLTSNYSYFKSVLRTVSPTTVSKGGTRIGDAVRTAMSDLLGIESNVAMTGDPNDPNAATATEAAAMPEQETFSDILLITDGEDHESYPEYAAKQAAGANVGLYAIGLGDPAGSAIRVTKADGSSETVMYKDQPVVSKLDSKVLTQMAMAGSRGAYLPAGTAHFDLVEFFEKKIVAQQPRKELTVEQVYWDEIFQPPLFLGLVLLVIALLIPQRPGFKPTVVVQEEGT